MTINENSWITNSEDAFLAIKCLGNETLAKIFLEIGGFKDSYLGVTEVRELWQNEKGLPMLLVVESQLSR